MNQLRWTSGRSAVLVVMLCLGSLTGRAEAQDREEFQLWSALLGTAATTPETPGLSFWLDVHGRRAGNGTVVIVRPAVGASITPWLSVWAGYAWVPVFDDATSNRTDEHRIWQQVILAPKLPELGLSFQSRTRFEQRFGENGDDVGFRLRQFVRANWQPDESFPMGVAVWDEIFIGLNDTDWGAPKGFDQNRLFIGPFLKLSPWARLEAGYLYVVVNRDSGDLTAHTLAINLFWSFKPSAPPPAAE